MKLLRNLTKQRFGVYPHLFSLLLVFTQANASIAQNVFPGTLWLQDQGDVDSLQIRYGNLEKILGSLWIGDVFSGVPTTSGIHDLSPLAGINVVYGGLQIRGNHGLKNLNGLQGLDSLYGDVLLISYNDSLENLEALGNMSYAYPLLQVSNNANLISLNGLTGINRCLELLIRDCPKLETLHGLDSLTTCESGISLRFLNNLYTLEGLNHLTTLYAPGYLSFLEITDCQHLLNLDGLEALTENQAASFHLKLENLPGLLNFDALQKLGLHQPRLGKVEIRNCDRIANLDGISSFDFIGSGLTIINNPLLRKINLPLVDTIWVGAQITNNAALNCLEFNQLTFASHLWIESNPSLKNIHTLSNLQALTDEVSLSLINNDSLLNLDGLENLRRTGGIAIIGNEQLVHINGLSGIDSIGPEYPENFNNIWVSIGGNQHLLNINGLQNLQFLHGSLVISSNPLVEFLDSFSQLDQISWDLRISFNPLLKSVSGFPRLQKIGNTFELWDNPSLTEISGFSNLDTIGNIGPFRTGSLDIGLNPRLKDFSPFQQLSYVGKQVLIRKMDSLETIAPLNGISETQSLVISENSILKGIDAFYQITSLPGSFGFNTISNNSSLQHVDGLRNIAMILDSLTVADNPVLEDCSALCEVKKHVPASKLKIRNNPAPCHQFSALTAWCTTLDLTDITDTLPAVYLYPNPLGSEQQLQIRCETCPETIVKVFDVKGNLKEAATTMNGHCRLETRTWLPGFYCIHLNCNNRCVSKWVIKL
ncbi:MAG: hypothetical protein JNJ57_01760 [Saprospiraceae bacterium]|nr:hypothetical protein [Saprospiraceae bacterium]